MVGLVHNTELSWDRNVKAEDAAKVDDEVTVLVKKIDRENRRVALSIKATQEDPWLTEAVAFKRRYGCRRYCREVPAVWRYRKTCR